MLTYYFLYYFTNKLYPDLFVHTEIYGGARIHNPTGSSANRYSSYYGEVHVNYTSIWGGMCDPDFDRHAAKVVCRDVSDSFADGMPYVRAVYTEVHYYPFWLGNVTCTGDELSLAECTNSGWGNHRDCETDVDNINIVCFTEPFDGKGKLYEIVLTSILPLGY